MQALGGWSCPITHKLWLLKINLTKGNEGNRHLCSPSVAACTMWPTTTESHWSRVAQRELDEKVTCRVQMLFTLTIHATFSLSLSTVVKMVAMIWSHFWPCIISFLNRFAKYTLNQVWNTSLKQNVCVVHLCVLQCVWCICVWCICVCCSVECVWRGQWSRRWSPQKYLWTAASKNQN